MSNRYAIIGVANRFPGSANTPQAFWDNLISRRDCISRAPADRWNADVFTSKGSYSDRNKAFYDV
jgi:acyl transferase domain-containing protein